MTLKVLEWNFIAFLLFQNLKSKTLEQILSG